MESADVLLVFLIWLTNSFIFDCIHFLFHKYSFSLHKIHHDFFDQSLTIRKKYSSKNLFSHVLLEFFIKLSSSFFFLSFVTKQVVLIVVCIEFLTVIYVLCCMGEDINHRTIKSLKRFSLRPYVSASYHAMHHQYPNNFFSSYHLFFDLLFGLACPIKNRMFIVTGSQGALGQAFIKQLKLLGANIVEPLANYATWKNVDIDNLNIALKSSDVLVLAHGELHQIK